MELFVICIKNDSFRIAMLIYAVYFTDLKMSID